MAEGTLALIEGVDPERLQIEHRAVLGPHIWITCGERTLSVIGELDFDQPFEPDRVALQAGVVEIGLLGPDGSLMADPLRRVPIPEAVQIVQAVTAGDISAFDREEYDRG